MTAGVEGPLRAFRRAATAAAIVTAVGVLAPACGGSGARVATVMPKPKPPVAPVPDLAHIGIVGPRAVDG
ncbi:MAG: hypothetical protein M3071_04725, partial [Actinomycetota bacterium]|nr:hypothetical protein [Actinomycetota bacterium]